MSETQQEVSSRTNEHAALNKVTDINPVTLRSSENTLGRSKRSATGLKQEAPQEVEAGKTNSSSLERASGPEYIDDVDGNMPSAGVKQWHDYQAGITKDSYKTEVNEKEKSATSRDLTIDLSLGQNPATSIDLPIDLSLDKNNASSNDLTIDLSLSQNPATSIDLPIDLSLDQNHAINIDLPNEVRPIENPAINLDLPYDVHPIENPAINYDTFADNRPQSQEKETIHSLSQTLLALVSLNDTKGSALFMHPKSMAEVNKSKNLQKLQNKKVRRLDLLFKINKQFIATDEDAANAVVEIQYVRGNRNMKHIVARCSKEYYDIEGCTMLRCHDVPIEVSEYLEESYLQLLNLVIQICTEPTFTQMFFVIGHLEGESKCHFSGNLFERFTMSSQDYEYLSLEELADHFFMRTMEINPDDWYKIRQTICPGDESLFVVRFERDRVAHLL
ncbi:hypothetical protein Bpfe_006110 [Biomphalaria pfeifferi]|uniref:Uncharacterized protein n=1 Tax=Biomphalaria pfeifferi TaxID=112525 RepID=A0AAD8C0V8_BIOPF|nr:hypothetical protein Bpfe_006110 [Biomphalaria pfeifferi]